MPNVKTEYTIGAKPTPYCPDGEIRAIHVAYTPPSNLQIGDIIEVIDLDDNTQVVDWAVFGLPTGLQGSLGELNAGRTALSTTWKAGITGVQRADSAAHLANTSGKRRVGFVPSAAQTAAGTVNLVLWTRAI